MNNKKLTNNEKEFVKALRDNYFNNKPQEKEVQNLVKALNKARNK